MSRRSKETLAVQLFPFLAVLVCTMGSLIFLLLVTTRQVRQRSIAYAQYQAEQQELARVKAQRLLEKSVPLPPIVEKPPAPVVVVAVPRREPKPFREPDRTYELALENRKRELEQLKAEWASRTDQLSKERDRHRTVLAHRQTAVDAAVIEAEALKAEIKRLEIELGKLAGTDAASSFSSTEGADRLLIEQQIAETKKRLRAAQAEEANGDNDKFQVVPFDPQTGTTRRPIFIECTAEGLRFLPEDITISAADLNGFTPRANPLAAGTGALVNYWSAWNSQQRNRKAVQDPYVLLLVRPDGAVAYYVAQRMLEPIHTAHGYELIEADTALQMPAVDAGAKAACQAAVERLLTERENIYRSAVNNGTGSSVYGGTGRYNKSGGSKSGGGAAGQPGGVPSGGGSSNGSGSNGGGGGAFTMTDLTGDEKEVGTRSWERVENFEGRPKLRRGQELERDLDGVQSRLAQGNGTQDSGGFGAEGSSDPDHPAGSTGGASGGSSGGATGGQTGGKPGARSGKAGPNSGRKGGPGTPSSSMTMNDLAEGDSDGMSEHEPGMPIGKRPNSKRNRPRSLSDATSSADTAANSNQGENDDSADTSGMAPDPLADESGDPSSRASGSSAPRSSRGKHRIPMREGKPGGKSKEIDDKQIEPEMLAGRRWGHCEPGASIGFERDVSVEVFEGHFIIAEKYEVRLEDGESKQEIFEEFVTSLDRYTREWGKPPQGFFWTPRLKFIVKPDANGRYEQINGLMTRAGLSTSHEFAKTADAIEFGREKPAAAKSAPKTANQHGTGGVR